MAADARSPQQGPASWRLIAPVAIAVALALVPAPPGLAQHAWYFFSLFCGIVAALILEPYPPAAVGFFAITFTSFLAPFTLFGPEEMAKPGFKIVGETVKWAFSGFASNTVWLVGGAFMFALGYEKTGLGRRIALLLVRALGRNTLMLGYATTFTEVVLAPFTPSNTARSAGTMYPVVVNLPPIYDSKPNDPSAYKLGSYIMWTTFAASCITSSLFITGCAPNFLAVDFMRKIAHVDVSYSQWFFTAAPFAVPLLLALPLIGYVVYPPSIRKSPEVPVWANKQLAEMGPPSRKELTLAGLVLIAIILWIFGGDLFDAAVVALMVISGMLIFRVVSWDEMARNHSAWTTLSLLATLVAMADGLGRTGFVKWFAAFVAGHVSGLSPTTVLIILILVYFYSHYFFSSLTAHTTALMPIMLGVGLGAGIEPHKIALGLAMTTGLMGVVSPYATGAGLPWYNSGYITSAEFWRNGTIYGAIFIATLIVVGLPFM
jgi:L-tartrate/succinate antiporter